jgi:hypothetical protein
LPALSVPKSNPPKSKAQTPPTGFLQQSPCSKPQGGFALLTTPEKTKRPLLNPAPFHASGAGIKRPIGVKRGTALYYIFLYFSSDCFKDKTEDIEEFEDNKIRSHRKKRSKTQTTCKHCNQRKKNQSCDLGMCLSCCSTFDEPCSIKEHDAFKQPSHHYNDRKRGEDVRELLIDLQLDQYLTLLIDNGFDTLQSLKNLSKELLIHLGIERLGHQVTLLSAIEQI